MKPTLRRRRAAWLAVLPLTACAPAVHGASSSVGCAPEGNLTYVCGAEKPEDLAAIPGSDWIIASGFSPGSGLKLINTGTRALERWFEGEAEQIAPAPERFPDCAAPPAVVAFNARGLSFRRKTSREGELHVVNHGGRESIEVFSVFWGEAPDRPRLAWRGCLLLPEGHVGNSVSTYSDGTVLVTVLTTPGTSITDFVLGRKTGVVLERAPGAPAFHPIPGTSLEGNNGLEASPEDDGFYVVAFGTRQIARFDRGSMSGPEWSVTAPEFMPDNIHWSDDRLLAAGMVRDEPACGGVRQVINGVADTMACHRGYIVAALDPQTRAWTIVAYGEPVASFNGVSAALVRGGELWLGSYQAGRIALRPLPGMSLVEHSGE